MFFLGLLLNGSFLYYCLHLLANLTVFWTHSPRGLDETVWTLMRFGERPDRIFHGWVRRILVFVLPFCLISSYPTRLLLESFDWRVLARVGGVSIAFFALVLFVWRLALRSYSSASS